MSKSIEQKRATFKAMHDDGCFLMPNAWDKGSARVLQDLGFPAIGSTSTGFAWTQGRPDYCMTRDDVVEHLHELVSAVDVPVNADFESGFARDIDELAESIRLAVESGVAALSLEDRLPAQSALYDLVVAKARVQAARRAIDESGPGTLLVARTETLLIHSDAAAVSSAIERLVIFAECGADVLFAPGVQKEEDIKALVRAVAPKPVSVMIMRFDQRVEELAALGVRRISVGGWLAQTAWASVAGAAEQMLNGSFAGLKHMPGKSLDEVFAGFGAS